MNWKGNEVIKAFNDSMVDSLTKSAILVKSKAVPLAPVDLGNLKGSITYVVNGTSTFSDKKSTPLNVNARGYEAIIGTNVFYAAYQEFGTRFMKANAFMFPALEKSRDGIFNFFSKGLKGLKWL